jgi:hypothetical protein
MPVKIELALYEKAAMVIFPDCLFDAITERNRPHAGGRQWPAGKKDPG